ncbi:MAG: M50 family metallopeptidase [bacterium]|nr:M50 family metallopeptidase [bacterium]
MTSAETPPVNPSGSLTFWQKLRRVNFLDGQTLIWRMIDLQRGTLVQIGAFFAFLLTFRFLFNWSWGMSLAMLISMFLHELGHAFVFRLADIKIVILYLFPLGAVAAPRDPEQNALSDTRHWNTISWLLQAGPAVNVGLMLIFLGLQPVFAGIGTDTGAGLATFAGEMVYVNGLLAVMNLVPVWTLDAGQLFKVIYNSLDEHEDRWVTIALLAGVAVLIVIAAGLLNFQTWAVVLGRVLQRFGWVVFLLIFAFGIVNQQRRDNPAYAASKQAMSNVQVFVQLGVYIALVLATLVVFAGGL